MNPLLIPTLTLCALSLVAYSWCKNCLLEVDLLKNRIAVASREATDLFGQNNNLKVQIKTNTKSLAEAKNFMETWQAAASKNSLAGPEQAVNDLSTKNDILVSAPRFETAKAYGAVGSKAEGLRQIDHRISSFKASGSLRKIVSFYSDIETGFPAAVIQSFSLSIQDSTPTAEITISTLSRDFSPFPSVLPPSEPAQGGVFDRLPDLTQFAIPELPDAILAKQSTKATTTRPSNAGANPIAQLVIGGIVWSEEMSKRRVFANGTILKPGQEVPTSLLSRKEKGVKAVLVRIEDHALVFRVETLVHDPVSETSVQSYSIHTIPFSKSAISNDAN